MSFQSRLIAIARRSSGPTNQVIRRIASASSAGRTADPDVHALDSDVEPGVFSGIPEETKNVAEPKLAEEEHPEDHRYTTKEADPFSTPRSPMSPSPKLESSPVHNPSEPNIHQKRNNSLAPAFENVSCAGLDGSPWPWGSKDQAKSDDPQEVESDKDYYGHYKASPLSELEFPDTRKPITRATDGTPDSPYYGGARDVIVWKPEQIDTAEEALLRAVRIWKENAMKGDPDAPHSRVLRKLRGE